MASKSNSYYMQKALIEIDAIIRYSKDKSYEELISNEQTIDSIMFRLIQLVENIKNLSLEFKNNHPEIPWGEIVGFRNGIVHEYGAVDYTTVYEIVTKDIYDLKKLFELSM